MHISKCDTLHSLGKKRYKLCSNSEVWTPFTVKYKARLGRFQLEAISIEWRRLHSEELHSLYRSPNIVRAIKSRRLRWARHVARMEEVRSAFKILTCKPTGKRPLGRLCECGIETPCSISDGIS